MEGNIMTDISKIDKNFAIKTSIEKDDIVFYDADEEPFKVYGVFRENGRYTRMPADVAKKVSEGVYLLHTNTAGGRVRFTTNSIGNCQSCMEELLWQSMVLHGTTKRISSIEMPTMICLTI